MTPPSNLIGFSVQGPARAPVVVLLHPSGLGPQAMAPLAAQLAPRRRVVVTARRGYAGSEQLGPAASLDTHADDLALLLDHLEVDQATFVGVSAGATLVLATAINHPTRVTSGLAHEPLIGPLAPQLDSQVSERAAALAASGQAGDVAGFVADLVGVETWNRLPPAWHAAVRANADAVLGELGAFPRFAPSPKALRRLGPLGVRTSVGARSGPARHQAAQVLRELGIACPVRAEVGHLGGLDQPRELAALVLGADRDGPAVASTRRPL